MHLPRSKHWFWFVIPIGIVVAIVCYRASIQRKISQAFHEIEASGYPSTLAELNKSYAFVPPNENAALKFSQNFRAFRGSGNERNLPVLGNGELPPLGEPLPKPMVAAIRKHLDANRQSLEAIDESMKLPRSRYAVDLSAGASLMLPYLAETKAAAQLLKLQAIFTADQGDNKLAAHAILNQIAVANTLRDEPILISQLVRIAILRIAVSTLEIALYRVDFEPGDFQRIANQLQKADQDQASSFKRSMAGERCFGIDWFQTSSTAQQLQQLGQLGLSQPMGLSPVLAARRLIGLWDADKLYCLNFMKRAIAVADQPLPEALDSSAALFSELEKTRRRYYIAGLLLPALQNAFTKSVETSAALRTARVGLALRERIAAGTSIADDIHALASSDLMKIEDPFTGKRLLTLRTNHSLLIYSVGRDRVDNHAKRLDKGYPLDNKDIVFEIRAEAIPPR